MQQLLAHLVGDYLIQSDWMATQKTERIWPAIVHGVIYSIPFLFLSPSRDALMVICITHILIDHFRIARYVVWFKNFFAPDWNEATDSPWNPEWDKCKATGYPPDRPVWLTVWLMIIADNTIHLIVNYFALKYL